MHDGEEIPISTACIGIAGGCGCDVGRVGGELQELHAQSLIRRYSAAFEDQNTSNLPKPEQRLLTPRLVTLRAHSGHGHCVVGPGFGCTSRESRRRCLGHEASEGRCGFDE